MRLLSALLVLAALLLVDGVLGAAAQAQQPLELELVRAPRRLDTVSVAVVAVHDLRPETASIGEAYTGMFNKVKPIALKGGTEAELLRFLQTRMPEVRTPEREGVRPVAVGVEVLHLSEQRTPMVEFGRAEIALQFFEVRGDSLGVLGDARAFHEARSGMDVTSTHADNLKTVLVDAVVDAAARGVLAGDPVRWTTLAEARAAASAEAEQAAALAPSALAGDDAARTNATAAPAGTATAARASATEAAVRSMRQFVTVGALVGGVARGGTATYGAWNGAATGDWIVPFSFGLTILSVDDEARGVTGAFFHSGGALSVVRRLNPHGLGLQADLQAIFGTESFEGSSRDSFFGGGRLGAGLAYYPLQTGPVVNAGVFGSRLFGSELYPSDVGVALSVGYQF